MEYSLSGDHARAELLAKLEPASKWVAGPPGVGELLAGYGRIIAAEEANARPVTRSKEQDARDKWLYGQCCEHVAYRVIIQRLLKREPWDSIESAQGIKDAANAYAVRNGLKPIPKRRNGRPRKAT